MWRSLLSILAEPFITPDPLVSLGHGLAILTLALAMWEITHVLLAWLLFFVPGGYLTLRGVALLF